MGSVLRYLSAESPEGGRRALADTASFLRSADRDLISSIIKSYFLLLNDLFSLVFRLDFNSTLASGLLLLDLLAGEVPYRILSLEIEGVLSLSFNP